MRALGSITGSRLAWLALGAVLGIAAAHWGQPTADTARLAVGRIAEAWSDHPGPRRVPTATEAKRAQDLWRVRKREK